MSEASRRKKERRAQMSKVKVFCKDCRFYQKNEKELNIGECRVSSPIVFVVVGQDLTGHPTPGTFSAFPSITGSTGWCGKGEPNPEIIS